MKNSELSEKTARMVRKWETRKDEEKRESRELECAGNLLQNSMFIGTLISVLLQLRYTNHYLPDYAK